MGIFGGSSSNTTDTTPPATSLRVQTSVAGRPIPVLLCGQQRMSGNLLWAGDFQSSTGGGGGKGGGGKGGGGGGGGGGKGGSSGGSSSTTYSSSFISGVCEGVIASMGTVWVDKNPDSLSAIGGTFFVGNSSQTAWGYIASAHPGDARNYRRIAYFAIANYNMGVSPQLPNFTVEVLAGTTSGIPGIPDGTGAQAITNYLTDPFYGVGFPSANLGDLTLYDTWCRAQGLFVSPALTDQQEASSFLGDMTLATSAEFVWSGSLLTVVPYGELPVTGNGVTYTPANGGAPIYALTDDDYHAPIGSNPNSNAASSSSDPVQGSQKGQGKQFNSIPVEYLDRSNQYNPTVIGNAKDDAEIAVFGLRQQDTKQLHFFCLQSAAATSAQLQLARQAPINTYAITVGPEFILLDPMDMVTLTDVGMGLVQQLVQIKEITENPDDNSLTLVVEEVLVGTGVTPLYTVQGSGGFNPAFNAPPPATNPVLVFPAPLPLANGLDLILVASGLPGWGGADVWASFDDSTFTSMPRKLGRDRQGVTTTALPATADPDTTNTLGVDLTMSASTLLSATKADADSFFTLCYVDGEFISYQTATLTAANKYNLTYLRRGLFNTPVKAHAAGTPFARLDGTEFQFPYTADQIGETVWLKLTAFNYWQGGEQQLTAVTAIPFVLPAPPPPPNVTAFSAVQNGEVVSFSWSGVDDGSLLEGYEIRYAPFGVSQWAQMVPLTEAHRGSEMTNAVVPPGTWTFGIRAIDIAGQFSTLVALASLAVSNTYNPVSNTPQNPGWAGNTLPVPAQWTALGTGVTASNLGQTAKDTVGGAKTQAQSSTPILATSPSAGATIVQFKIDAAGVLSKYAVGLANSTELLTNTLGDTAQSLGYFGDSGHVVVNGSTVKTIATYAVGNTVDMAVNAAASLVWFRVTGGNWNNAAIGVENPALELGGIPIAGLLAANGAVLPAWSGFTINDQVTADFGAVAFANPPPAGYSPNTSGGSGWIAHYSGILVPDSASIASSDAAQNVFDFFVWDPVASGTYVAPGLSLAKVATIRVTAQFNLGVGAGQGGVAPSLPQLKIRYSITGGVDPAMWTSDGNAMWSSDSTPMWSGLTDYIPWTKGIIVTDYVQEEFTAAFVQGQLPYVIVFAPLIDQPVMTDGTNGAVVGATGTRINFNNRNYLNPPFVNVQPVGTSALTGTAASVDADGFTAHVFNSAGTEVGGTVNWSAHN